MKLLTEAQRRELIANGERSAAGEPIYPRPVVKLFTSDAGTTWLLTELDPTDLTGPSGSVTSASDSRSSVT